MYTLLLQGSNAEFTFHLVNLLSNDPLPFNISQSLDGETGNIQLSAALDFEAIEQYKIEVTIYCLTLFVCYIYIYILMYIRS